MNTRCCDVNGLVHLYDAAAQLTWCMADPRTWTRVRRDTRRRPSHDVPLTCVFCLWLTTRSH